ncbi:hypothetical protein Gotri_004741, partial [Gossypium trilobum]|nr:hypothetical protein [Gossypium trilobum]
ELIAIYPSSWVALLLSQLWVLLNCLEFDYPFMSSCSNFGSFCFWSVLLLVVDRSSGRSTGLNNADNPEGPDAKNLRVKVNISFRSMSVVEYSNIEQ